MSENDQAVDEYVRQLETELTARGASSTDVAEATGNVRAQVSEDGRSPVEVFGKPSTHAKRLVAIDAPPPPVAVVLLRLVVAAAAAWIGTGALIALVRGEELYGLPAVVPLVLSVLALVGLLVAARRGSR